MPSSPLTDSRVPDGTYEADVAAIVSNAVTDIESHTIPRFASTTVRDQKYAAWSAATGKAIANGMRCFTTAGGGVEWLRYGGSWIQVFSDAGWDALSPNSPFTATSKGARYKVEAREVWVVAQLTRSSAWSANTAVFTVPEPPAYEWYLHAVVDSNITNATVRTDGVVLLGRAGGAGDVVSIAGKYPTV